MKIAVAGCGICGATVSFLLAEYGFDVTIFEQAPECQPVGAGVMLQASGQQVMQRLGLLQSLESTATRLKGMTAKLSTGRTLVRLRFGKLDPDNYSLGVHRGRLFHLLLEKCLSAGVKIQNGCRVGRFQQQGGVVFNESGEELGSGFEFLIATDGAHSSLRRQSGIPFRETTYDYGAIWMTSSCDYQPGELYQVVEGTHRLLGLLPIGNGESSFFWGLPAKEWPRLRESNFAEWKRAVVGFCPESESVLASPTSFDDFAFGTYCNVSMKEWCSNGVLFIGDSAHATSPHLGQGVNLALEDAETFAKAFNESKKLEEAYVVFRRERRRKIRFYQSLTGMLTPFFQSQGSIRGSLRNVALPWLPGLPWVGKEMLRTLSGTKNGWWS